MDVVVLCPDNRNSSETAAAQSAGMGNDEEGDASSTMPEPPS
jgi:hypothetical protein